LKCEQQFVEADEYSDVEVIRTGNEAVYIPPQNDGHAAGNLNYWI
jgi:hypothetical protein